MRRLLIATALLVAPVSAHAATTPINLAGWVAGGAGPVTLCEWPSARPTGTSSKCRTILPAGDFIDVDGKRVHNDTTPITPVFIVLELSQNPTTVVVNLDGKNYSVSRTVTYIICDGRHMNLDLVRFNQSGSIEKCGADVVVGGPSWTPWGRGQ